MRRLRWSPDAATDLERIVAYIREENRSAATRVAHTVVERAASLKHHPHLGRPGRVEGTRELPLSPLPFLLVYRVLESADIIEIVNVIHGAQRWPPVP